MVWKQKLGGKESVGFHYLDINLVTFTDPNNICFTTMLHLFWICHATIAKISTEILIPIYNILYAEGNKNKWSIWLKYKEIYLQKNVLVCGLLPHSNIAVKAS